MNLIRLGRPVCGIPTVSAHCGLRGAVRRVEGSHRGPGRSWGSLLTHYVPLQSRVTDNNHIQAGGWATGGYSCLVQACVARGAHQHHSHAVPCSRAAWKEEVRWYGQERNVGFTCHILLKESGQSCIITVIKQVHRQDFTKKLGAFWGFCLMRRFS